MLLSLSIRDIVLIDKLDLDFSSGLGVLTGETGSGKSILLDALGLALGARGDTGLIRPGADQASVAASFEVPKDQPAQDLLRDQGMDTDGAIVLRRVITVDGRSRAYVNDQPASVGLLRRLGEALVDIQGHFDQQGLLNPASHRTLLDAFGGYGGAAEACRDGHRSWRAAEDALSAAEADAASARADEELLRHSLAELDDLAPEPGEDKSLSERRNALMHREKIIEALNDAHAELSGGRPVEDSLSAAQVRLEKVAGLAGGALDPVAEALGRATLEVAEAVRLLASSGHDLDAEPGALAVIDDRLFALRDVARKHRCEVDDLPAVRERFAARLEALDNRDQGIAQLRDAAAVCRRDFAAAAKALSARRRKAAKALDRTVTAELPPLKLEKARFETALEPLDQAEWTADGAERVVFRVATNAGAALGPLGKIASAGELSRFMLALKVALSQTAPVPTLIFDEVDSGIGGATAAAVGERLERLGRDVQVLVVTHSPQVAARGAHHWRVQKTGAGDGTVTMVDQLAEPARREEIARMLSGATITDEARAAADSLIGGTGA
jgi:DNA repair protein RecN (Recombination protein N)